MLAHPKVYRPAQATPGSARRTETAAGAAIYAVGLALLGSALAAAAAAPHRPASRPARQPTPASRAVTQRAGRATLHPVAGPAAALTPLPGRGW